MYRGKIESVAKVGEPDFSLEHTHYSYLRLNLAKFSKITSLQNTSWRLCVSKKTFASLEKHCNLSAVENRRSFPKDLISKCEKPRSSQ